MSKATIKAYNSNVVIWYGEGDDRIYAPITCTGDEPKYPLNSDYSDDEAMTNGYELANYLTSLNDEELAQWLEENTTKPLLLGPDSESEQWVAEVAELAKAPFEILKKVRSGDLNVAVSVPQVDAYKEHTPVLIDDIISSGRTLLSTLEHLKKAGMKPAVCIGTHGLFATKAWELLKESHTKAVITSNSVPHPSNALDLSSTLAKGLQEWLATS